jgi:hypothetical protein
VLSVQHECAIYGGAVGSLLLALLRQLDLPIITHLHTIIEEPSAEHMDLMQEFIRLSTRLIVMNKRGRPDLDLRGLQVHESDLRILE